MSQGSRPLRVGLIGAGGIAAHHLPAYAERPELVALTAVCDLSEERASRVAADAGADEVFIDSSELLDQASIDAVDICAPPGEHFRLTMEAIRRGLHVLVEKPFGCSLDEAIAMVESAASAGVTVMVAQNLRFTAAYREARTAILTGEIGTVTAVRMDLMMDFPAMFPKGDWHYDAIRAGGGVVNNGAVHLLDLCRFLVGEARIVSAECRTTRSDLFVNGAEDLAVADLIYDNGAVGQLFASFSATGSPWEWRVMILGDRGTITNLPLDARLPLGPVSLTALDRDGRRRSRTLGGTSLDDSRGWGFVDEILHFAECCRSGAEPISSGRDNLGTMRQVFGICGSSG